MSAEAGADMKAGGDKSAAQGGAATCRDGGSAKVNPALAMRLLGVLQGGLLLWLWKASDGAFWPATAPVALGALLWPALVVPLAWYLSERTGASIRFRLFALGLVAVVYAALGAYAGWMGEPLREMDATLRLRSIFGSFAHVAAAGVLGFVLLTLVLHRRRQGWPSAWHYPSLFELAWRNASLCLSALALTGLFWLVLFAGAGLFKAIGLGFMLVLITQSEFVFPVTALVVAEAFAQGQRHESRLVARWRGMLSLMAWLLPLMLAFSLLWTAALPFTGVETLFSTGHAALLLLWFVALGVHFLNCAWQDGSQDGGDAPLYPRGLSRFVSLAWLSMLPVVLIAAWALWLRIDQYGLTEQRIWAAFVCLLALLYVAGYAASVLRRGAAWLAFVGPTNIAVSLLMCAGLAMLVSPLGDPRRLAVQDQVSRLLAGEVAVERFDYMYLYRGAGQWGRRALETLAGLTGEGEGDVRTQDIAERARKTLEHKGRWKDVTPARDEWTLERLREHVEVLSGPAATEAEAEIETATVPDSLYQWLLTARRETGMSTQPYCLPRHECALWMVDLDGDGAEEALLLVRFAGDGRAGWSQVLAQEGAGWQVVATLQHSLPLSTWRRNVREGTVQLLAPRWPELVVGEERLLIQSNTK